MSHSKSHLEGVVKNLLAFETHAQSDGCPHCMGKHILATQQFLEEEAQQRDSDFPQLAQLAASIKDALPSVYQGDGTFHEGRMNELGARARTLRLKVMGKLGIPDHKHLKEVERRIKHEVLAHAH